MDDFTNCTLFLFVLYLKHQYRINVASMGTAFDKASVFL